MVHSEIPNQIAVSEDFEFQALNEAVNYRQSLIREFQSALKGKVLEVGAGIGQLSCMINNLEGVDKLVSIEPDPQFCKTFREENPDIELIEGTALNIAVKNWDAIISVNVLEHIESDENELKTYCDLLRERHGKLCLFVPARPEIYAPIDEDFGHFRRYTKETLRRRLDAAGFKIEQISYYNFIGYFAWWWVFKIRGSKSFQAAKVRFFDRCIFPWAHWLESQIMRPPIGQSLIVIASPSV